jgi:uncharacterized protein YjbI with pentapeptide repeats
MTKFHVRTAFSGSRILHTVEIAGETPLYAPDLRGISLENAHLNGADLRFANLSGVCLRGARLRETILDHSNLSGADLSYTDLSGASLREADLRGTVLYPAETSGAKFYGSKISASDDAAEYARIALDDMCLRTGIKLGSVAYRKLQRINGLDRRVREFRCKPPQCTGSHQREINWD